MATISIQTGRLERALEYLSKQDRETLHKYLFLRKRLLVVYFSFISATKHSSEILSEMIEFSEVYNIEQTSLNETFVNFFNYQNLLSALDSFFRFFENHISKKYEVIIGPQIDAKERQKIRDIRNKFIEHFESMQLPLHKAYEKYFSLEWKLEEIREFVEKVIQSIEFCYLLALTIDTEKKNGLKWETEDDKWE